MRTDVRTAVALKTFLFVPDGHIGSDSALFIGGNAKGRSPVLVSEKSAYRQIVSRQRV